MISLFREMYIGALPTVGAQWIIRTISAVPYSRTINARDHPHDIITNPLLLTKVANQGPFLTFVSIKLGQNNK